MLDLYTMNLTIYVHDFHSQIGHSKATQELLNGLTPDQKASISSIEIVAFTCSDLNQMFPDFHCKKYFTPISFPKLKPFILKMFYFHLASLVHSFTKGLKRKKIGIGIACLNVDIVNVQFIHEQWKNDFFKHRQLTPLSMFYKRILFLYFLIAEKYVYSNNRNSKYIVIANFLKNYLQHKFHTNSDRMTLIPSGVNSIEFSLIENNNEDLKLKISQNHKEIEKIDVNQPIALFVGALERKGFFKALAAIQKIPNAQLIVIGRSEDPNFVMPKLSLKIIHIDFTKEVRLFYQLADMFIFPTTYEPFGLVILEAYATGLDLVIPRENVGASEIILETEGIYFFEQKNPLILPPLKKISLQEKKDRRIERLALISDYTWSASGEKLYTVLCDN